MRRTRHVGRARGAGPRGRIPAVTSRPPSALDIHRARTLYELFCLSLYLSSIKILLPYLFVDVAAVSWERTTVQRTRPLPHLPHTDPIENMCLGIRLSYSLVISAVRFSFHFRGEV